MQPNQPDTDNMKGRNILQTTSFTSRAAWATFRAAWAYPQGSVGLSTGQCGPIHRAAWAYPQRSMGLPAGQRGPTHRAACWYPQASVGLPTGQHAGILFTQ